MNAVTSDDAERNVIGAILLHPISLSDVADVVRADDFANPLHRAIYEAVSALDVASKPIDRDTVSAEMQEAGTFAVLSKNGGADYFAEVQTYIAGVENVRYHAKAVATKAHRRRCALAMNELSAAAQNVRYRDEDFFSEMDRRIAELADSRREVGGARKFSASVNEAVRTLKDRFEAKNAGQDVAITGLRTKLDDFDHMTGGLKEGKLYVLAARPKMGKTSLLINFTTAIAAQGYPVLGLSLEMDDQELILRALAAHASLDGKAIERVELGVPEWSRLQKSAGELHGLPVWIDSKNPLTFDALRSRARRWRSKEAAGKRALIWVDYLQLIEGSGGEENRQQEITRISRGLKGLAKELQCPVIALSQLNRGVENRDEKRPRLSDIRESGSVEQDADLVAFIYRDEVYNPSRENQGTAELIVSAHRGGVTGTIMLEWEARYTRFKAAADREPPRNWQDNDR